MGRISTGSTGQTKLPKFITPLTVLPQLGLGRRQLERARRSDGLLHPLRRDRRRRQSPGRDTARRVPRAQPGPIAVTSVLERRGGRSGGRRHRRRRPARRNVASHGSGRGERGARLAVGPSGRRLCLPGDAEPNRRGGDRAARQGQHREVGKVDRGMGRPTYGEHHDPARQPVLRVPSRRWIARRAMDPISGCRPRPDERTLCPCVREFSFRTA